MKGCEIKIHRVYDFPYPEGFRILVDGLWPRGIKKENIDYWAKSISPSPELRKWYSHEIIKWQEFKKRYFEELETNPNLESFLQIIKSRSNSSILFLYSSREKEYNNAKALMEFVFNKLQ